MAPKWWLVKHIFLLTRTLHTVRIGHYWLLVELTYIVLQEDSIFYNCTMENKNKNSLHLLLRLFLKPRLSYYQDAQFLFLWLCRKVRWWWAKASVHQPEVQTLSQLFQRFKKDVSMRTFSPPLPWLKAVQSGHDYEIMAFWKLQKLSAAALLNKNQKRLKGRFYLNVNLTVTLKSTLKPQPYFSKMFLFFFSS